MLDFEGINFIYTQVKEFIIILILFLKISSILNNRIIYSNFFLFFSESGKYCYLKIQASLNF